MIANTEMVDYKVSLHETNILKGVAICAMLVHHLFMDYGGNWDIFAWMCKVCVSIFLFLSGYGLTIQYTKTLTQPESNFFVKTVKFWLRRFAKFYLNYWMIFAIVVPVGILAFGRSLSEAYGTTSFIWAELLKDVFGLRGYGSYNVTWWFNALILSFYLLFPLFYFFMRNRWIALGVLAVMVIRPESLMNVFCLLNGDLPNYGLVFVMGIFYAKNVAVIGKALNKLNVNVVFILFAILAMSSSVVREMYKHSKEFYFNTDVLTTLFLVIAVVALCRISKRLIKPLAFLGKHSMNMYLVHTFICVYFFSDFIYGFKYPVLIFAVLLGTSLLFSVVLEFAKSKLGFYKLQDAITRRILPRPQE